MKRRQAYIVLIVIFLFAIFEDINCGNYAFLKHKDREMKLDSLGQPRIGTILITDGKPDTVWQSTDSETVKEFFNTK